jgi:hypothetical protein
LGITITIGLIWYGFFNTALTLRKNTIDAYKVYCSPKIRPVVKLGKDHWNEERNDECAHAQTAQC